MPSAKNQNQRKRRQAYAGRNQREQNKRSHVEREITKAERRIRHWESRHKRQLMSDQELKTKVARQRAHIDRLKARLKSGFTTRK